MTRRAALGHRKTMGLGLLASLAVFWLANLGLAAQAQSMIPLTPSAFVKITRDYDLNSDTFINAPPAGEGAACFQITGVDANGVHTVMISGAYHPWWSDTAILPGATDVWSNSPGYLENRPDAAPLDQIRQLFAIAAACPSQ